jgi:hypothetical protein
MTQSTLKNTARIRFPKHTSPYVFALYMATIMAFMMSLVITFAEFGAGDRLHSCGSACGNASGELDGARSLSLFL